MDEFDESYDDSDDDDLLDLLSEFTSQETVPSLQDASAHPSFICSFVHQIETEAYKAARATLENYQYSLIKITDIVSITQCLSFFLFLLKKKQTKRLINELWNKNPDLAAYFSGESIQIQAPHPESTPKTQTLRLNSQEVLKNFNAALKSESQPIITFMWHKNKKLASFFSGLPTEIKRINQEGKPESKITQINMQELIKNFETALRSRSNLIIQSIWEANPQLAGFFSGNPDNKTLQINNEKLIEHFKLTLASHSDFIISAMWNNNRRLKTAIQALDTEELSLLIKNVLACNVKKDHEIKTSFLNAVCNIHALTSCLAEISAIKNLSRYMQKKIDPLRQRISEIKTHSHVPLIQNSMFNNAKEKRSNNEEISAKTKNKILKTDEKSVSHPSHLF